MEVDRDRCTGCGYCLLTCTADAIESDGWATIDEEECTLCGLCPSVCLTDAFSADPTVEEPKREYESDYDVLIIGSGIGGLMTAAALARDGRRVGVFEKLSFVGGRYTEINYSGYAVTTDAWTGTESGQTFGQVGGQRMDPKSPVSNLCLVGMDVIGSGAAGDLIPIGVRRLLEYLS